MTGLIAARSAEDDLGSLMQAILHFDQTGAGAVLVHSFLERGVDVTVTRLIIPMMAEIGDAWESGRLSVAHEHAASQVVRRVAGSVTLDGSTQPEAAILLACPPGEHHDLMAQLIALMLESRGVRTLVLGANTPMPALSTAVRRLRPAATVLSATRATALESVLTSMHRLAEETTVMVAGRGAANWLDPRIAVLPQDPLAAVQRLAGLAAACSPARGASD